MIRTLALVLLLYSAGGAVAEPLDLSWEAIFKSSNGAREAVLSPDGKRVAVAASIAGTSRLFLVDVATGDREALSEGAEPVWFNDGRRLLYRADNDLWIYDTRKDVARRLTIGAEDEFKAVPSPDGRRVAFFSTRAGARDLYVISAKGGKLKQLTDGSMGSDDLRYGPAWSPDGKMIAFHSNKASYWEDDLWVVDVKTAKARQVSNGFMVLSRPVWSPDGASIAVFGAAKSGFWYHDLADIYIVDPAGGAERRVAMQVQATEFLHRLEPRWSVDGADLFFPYHQRGELELWRVPQAGGVATRVSHMGGFFSRYDASGDGFVFVRSTPTRGAEVDYLPIAGGALRTLTRFAPDWQGLVAPQQISFRSFDGLYIQGFRFNPPDFDPAKTYPALVMVHGGGTNSFYNGLNLREQALAQRGYVVLAVNYRGGSGFGRAFQDLAVEDWGNAQAFDAAAAGTFLRAQPWSNGKVGIYGYSYGGIMTMAAITRAPDVFDAAVPMAGIYDFADAHGNADRVGKVFIQTGHGGPPAERPEIYAISNALSRVDRVKTPVLIMHGDRDVRAPFRQFELAVDILTREGKTFESKVYEGEPHGFRNPDNRVDLYRRLEAWFDRWMRE